MWRHVAPALSVPGNHTAVAPTACTLMSPPPSGTGSRRGLGGDGTDPDSGKKRLPRGRASTQLAPKQFLPRSVTGWDSECLQSTEHISPSPPPRPLTVLTPGTGTSCCRRQRACADGRAGIYPRPCLSVGEPHGFTTKSPWDLCRATALCGASSFLAFGMRRLCRMIQGHHLGHSSSISRRRPTL